MYNAVIIGAGLGGLTTGAILARAGCKVLVIERNNSVGGAASSYKAGDLFIEGSLHETSDPRDPRDPKHAPLVRAGVLDAVKWIPSGTFYEVRGGPIGTPFVLPDNYSDARAALLQRFPEAAPGIQQFIGEMERISSAAGTLSQRMNVFRNPLETLRTLTAMLPTLRDWNLTLSQKLDRLFGSNEAIKCAIAANLSYYHDDPSALWWMFFALAQGSYLQSGGCYIQGGSQRLSSALARVIKTAGSDVILRRVVSAIGINAQGHVVSVTHTAKDGSDPKTVETKRVISNAAPETTAALMADMSARKLRDSFANRKPSISLFALTLGLSKPPRDLGVSSYSTQLLPDWMTTLDDYAQGAAAMACEPQNERMPPLAIVDYAAIDSGVPTPPYSLSVIGPDLVSNWSDINQDAYRAKRARWQAAMIGYLDRHYPGLEAAVITSSFNTALSVRQYLGTPDGAVYGFAPTPPRSIFSLSPSLRTPVTGLYLASAYAGFGGYTGVIQSAGACADMILRDKQ